LRKSIFAGAVFSALLALGGLIPASASAQSGIYNWTGFYGGLHAGGAFSQTKGSDEFFDPPTEITRQNMHGAFGGAQFGYNYQFGRVVWGAELSGSYGQINGSGDCFTNSASLLAGGESLDCHARQDWNLQLLSKLGYAFGDGRLLPYVTGGVVLSRLSVMKDDLNNPIPPATTTWGGAHMQPGMGLGAGFQYALGNGFSVGVEYLYTTFLNQDHSSIATCDCVILADQNLTTQSVRVVLNYTFGSPQPVSANTAAIPGHAASGIYDWTGLYIGGHAGGEWASRAGSTNGDFFDVTKQNLSGALGGVQLGYNHQFGHVVLGAELSGSWSKLDNTNFCFQTNPVAPGEEASCRAQVDRSAQFVTRLGYAFDDGRLLPYVVGGVAIAHMNLHFTDAFLGAGAFEWGGAKIMTGAVFGAGVQYAIGNGYSLGLEYLYTRYGSQDFSSQSTFNGAPFFSSYDRSDLTSQTLRVVANYKFGDAPISDRERAGKRFYDWTGFYIGAHAGRGWGSATGFDEIANSPPVPPGDASAQTIRGTFGGAQLGYNHQFGRVVLGSELSASLGGLGGNQDCFATAAIFGFPDSFNCRVKQQWSGQMLTRLGYAFDEGRMLPYILGGVSLAKFNVTHEISDPIFGSASWGDSRVHAGPVFGFGFQYALQNDLSLGIEYLYTPYGTQRYTSDVSGPFAPAPNFPGAFTQNLTSNSIRVVLNYKFDGMDFGGR
jgi:outer membrane immunogenic protein